MRSFLLRLYWAGKLLFNGSFVVILKNDAIAHIKLIQPLLFENVLALEAQYATLQEFKVQFENAVRQFEEDADKLNKTKKKGGKPRASKKSTR